MSSTFAVTVQPASSMRGRGETVYIRQEKAA